MDISKRRGNSPRVFRVFHRALTNPVVIKSFIIISHETRIRERGRNIGWFSCRKCKELGQYFQGSCIRNDFKRHRGDKSPRDPWINICRRLLHAFVLIIISIVCRFEIAKSSGDMLRFFGRGNGIGQLIYPLQFFNVENYVLFMNVKNIYPSPVFFFLKNGTNCNIITVFCNSPINVTISADPNFITKLVREILIILETCTCRDFIINIVQEYLRVVNGEK